MRGPVQGRGTAIAALRLLPEVAKTGLQPGLDRAVKLSLGQDELQERLFIQSLEVIGLSQIEAYPGFGIGGTPDVEEALQFRFHPGVVAG